MGKDYMNELKEALKNTTLNLNLDKIDPDKDLFSQKVDSFDYLMLLYAVQDCFHVEVPDDAMISGSLNTLNKIFELIRSESD